MDSARPHQRRFRRKFKLLTLRGRHTRNGSGSPENGDSNPLITNDTNDERSGEDTKEPSARFQPSEASQAIPRIQVELPPPTLTEQKLAQLKLEKTLLIQARHLVAAVHADLGFSMNRFEVCTSLLAPRPDRSAPEGHTPPVYVTRTTVTPPTVGPEQPVGWRVVMQGNGVFYSAVDSLEAFVSELRVRLEHRAAEYGPYLNGV